MEVGYRCKDCQETWDGGLHDEQCPKCKSKNSKVIWNDESNDEPEYRECDDYGGEDEDN